jgi:uncharacterized membrane protein YgdD (TMEM256/DUF423 family)
MEHAMNASRIHLLLAALMGASGVGLAALASHAGEANIAIAAQFLLIHAAALLGLTACRKQGLMHDRSASLAAWTLILGTLLFAVDLVIRARLGIRLFPFAAPLGGGLMILAWLTAGVSVLLASKQRG